MDVTDWQRERKQTRQITVGRVPVGGGAPIIDPVDDDHQDRRRRGHAPADLRAGGRGLRHRALHVQRGRRPPRVWPRSCRARRSRSSPTSTTSTRWRWPRSRPACTGCGSTRATSASPSTSRRSPAEARDRNLPIRIGVNAGSLDPSLYEKYGGATPEAMVESAHAGDRLLPRGRLRPHQDLGQGVERAADGRGLPAAVRGHRPSAPPRCHRGRSAAGGPDQGHGRHRHAADGGHRRHDPLLAHGRPGRGGPRRSPAARGARVCASARTSI